MMKGITEELSSVHQEIIELLDRIEQERNAEERTRLLYNLETTMIPHLLAEEQAIYPKLKSLETESARRQWEDSAAQHHALRMLLRDLAETPANEDLYLAKVRMLRDFFRTYLNLEEGEIFQSLEQLSEEEREKLSMSYRSERKTAPCAPATKGWFGGM